MPKKSTKRKPAKRSTTSKASKKGSVQDTGPVFVERPQDIKGITDLRWVVNSTLNENPQNWKDHPKRQQDVLRADIGEDPGKGLVGWAGAALYNKRTNRLIDGHGRQKLYKDKPEAIVPVLVGDWSEEEERTILLHLDPTAAMAETNASKLKSLQEQHQIDLEAVRGQLEANQQKALDNLNTDLTFQAEFVEAGGSPSMLANTEFYDSASDKIEDTPEIATMGEVATNLEGSLKLKEFYEVTRDDWETGPYDFPLLSPDLIPEISLEVRPWVGPETKPYEEGEEGSFLFIYGSTAIEKVRCEQMIVSFWTFDSKFEAVWNNPTKFTSRMLNLGIQGVVTPDYSVFNNGWLAQQIWQTFRSRWLGRYWQSVGLNVIPNISLIDIIDDDLFKLSIAGIPKYANCLGVQVQTKADADKNTVLALWKTGIQKVVHTLQPKQLLLYHGPDLPEGYEESFDCEVVKCISWMTERRKIINSKDYLT